MQSLLPLADTVRVLVKANDLRSQRAPAGLVDQVRCSGKIGEDETPI
jgi:hypothetical protein